MELQKSKTRFGGLLGNSQPLKDFKLGHFRPTTRNVLWKYIYQLYLNPETHQNIEIAAWDTAECLIKTRQPACIPLISHSNIQIFESV